MDIKGHTVHRVMIAQGAEIAEEYYFSFLLDRANRTYLAMCSKEGGMEIEQLAVERPEALARVAVDPNVGVDEAKAREIVDGGRLRRRRPPPAIADGPAEAVDRLPRGGRHARRGQPARARPRTATSSRSTARSRSTRTPTSATPTTRPLEDNAAADPLEAAAKEKGLNYVKLDGSVGIIGNGAGLVMCTLDVVAYAGEEYGGVRSRPTSSTSVAARAPR